MERADANPSPNAPAPVSVGRIVHYYEPHLSIGFNGQRGGPYAAIVTQTFANADGSVNYANLKVFPPFSEPFDRGSIPEFGSQYHHDADAPYWAWPPRT